MVHIIKYNIIYLEKSAFKIIFNNSKMGCDYYVQSELVIEYINKNNTKSITKTNRDVKKCWIYDNNSNSDDDINTQDTKYLQSIKNAIEENTYKKIIYQDEKWVSYSYEKKYKKELTYLCPNMLKIIKIYKDYYAWKRQ